MKYLLTAIFAIVLIGLVFTLAVKLQSNFEKPTLLQLFHKGKFNRTTIDFKTDGTYIFDNAATELKDFKYGRYQLDGNRIRLDKSELDSVIKTNLLEIQSKKVAATNETKSYVYQINDKGEILQNKVVFEVLLDNRKK